MDKIERNTYYLDIDELLPTENMITNRDKEFIDGFLDKLRVDYNEDDDIIMSTKQLVYLITITVREYERLYGRITH
jgi:hypothetical protein